MHESEVTSHHQTHWYFWHKMFSGIDQHFITSYWFRPGQVLVPNLKRKLVIRSFLDFRITYIAHLFQQLKENSYGVVGTLKSQKYWTFTDTGPLGWWEWMARHECFTEGKNKGGEGSSHLQEQGASPVEGPRGAAQSMVYNRHISCHYFLCLDPLFPFPAIPFLLHHCLRPRTTLAGRDILWTNHFQYKVTLSEKRQEGNFQFWLKTNESL